MRAPTRQGPRLWLESCLRQFTVAAGEGVNQQTMELAQVEVPVGGEVGERGGRKR